MPKDDHATLGDWTHQDLKGMYVKPFKGWVYCESGEYHRGRYTVLYEIRTTRMWGVYRDDDAYATVRFETAAQAREWVERQEAFCS